MKAAKKIVYPVRANIDLSHETQLRYWTKHLGVSGDELHRAIEKVGNSASAVRKQLALSRQDAATV